MCQSRQFVQQTRKRTENLIRCLPWESNFTTDNTDAEFSDLYHDVLHCLDCTSTIINQVINNAKMGPKYFRAEAPLPHAT